MTDSAVRGISQTQAPSLLVIGCGDLGGACASHFAAVGWNVTGVRRHPLQLPGVSTLTADVTDPASLAPLHALAPDFVLLTLTPGAFTDERYRAVYVDGLRHVLDALDRSRLRRVFWVSSTSVYHQDDGSVVDEDSPTAPTGFSGRRLLAAEQLLAATGLPHTCVRFGGIYGPARDRLLRQLHEGRRTPVAPIHISNRIHRDDAVGILQYLLECAHTGRPLAPCYIGVDTAPTPIAEVERWLAGHLQIDYARLTPTANAPRGGNKQCSSARLQQLGYRFRYPSYREGLPTLVRSEKAS